MLAELCPLTSVASSRCSSGDHFPVAPITSRVARSMVVDAPIDSHKLICHTNYTLTSSVSLRLAMKLKMMNDTLYKVRGWVAPLRQTIWSLSLSQLLPHSTQKKKKHQWGSLLILPSEKKAKMQTHTNTFWMGDLPICGYIPPGLCVTMTHSRPPLLWNQILHWNSKSLTA